MKFRSTDIVDSIPTVILPIETVARELDSKLVLASALAAHGCRVIVGHKKEARAIGHNSGPLVWQGKNLFSDRSDDHTADHLLKNGSAIMFMQDEGGMFQASFWKENVIQKHHLGYVRTRSISRMCAWGQKQKEVMSDEAPEIADLIAVTGTPRFDICAPRFAWIEGDAVQDIQNRFSPYILVCTRFGSITNSNGVHDAMRRKLNPRIWPKTIDKSQVADIWFTKWHQDVHDFADFVILIKELATSHPHRQIILRPHPSESMIFYRHAFAQFENVAVEREGNVLNWIRGAELVVHSNCTTGIEAVLAGRPVLNFLPMSVDRTGKDVEVAREAGRSAGSVAEALELTDALLAGNEPPHMWPLHALAMLNNLQKDSIPLMVDETLAVIREREIDGTQLRLPAKQRTLRFLRRTLGRPEFGQSPYVAAKRGPLDSKQIEAVLAGCHESGVGGGRIRTIEPQYVVIDP